MASSNLVYALIPAAGSGSRSGSDHPKQFAVLRGEPVLAHSLRALLRDRRVETAYVVLAREEDRFRNHDWSEFGERVAPLYCGGETRAGSVINGLTAMANRVDLRDWVMVHDAARPCLRGVDVTRLIDRLAGTDDPVGGLLAVPLADTLKRARAGQEAVLETVDRTNLWQALTPQMFRFDVLLRALESAHAAGTLVTDEASAVETLKLHIRLIAGSRTNMKITFPEDFATAERLLDQP